MILLRSDLENTSAMSDSSSSARGRGISISQELVEGRSTYYPVAAELCSLELPFSNKQARVLDGIIKGVGGLLRGHELAHGVVLRHIFPKEYYKNAPYFASKIAIAPPQVPRTIQLSQLSRGRREVA